MNFMTSRRFAVNLGTLSVATLTLAAPGRGPALYDDPDQPALDSGAAGDRQLARAPGANDARGQLLC